MGGYRMGSICIGYTYFRFHDFQCEAIFISLGRVSFSVYLSLELNGMSSVLWCLFLFPPWGAVALTSVYVRARTLVLSGTLFILLVVIVEVFLCVGFTTLVL
jgi:hypothetical protein